MTDYQKDQNRFFDQLDDTTWAAGKREAIEAKVAEAEAAGVKRSLIHEAFTVARRDYPKWRRSNLGREVNHGILCEEDEIIRRLQYEIDRKRRR